MFIQIWRLPRQSLQDSSLANSRCLQAEGKLDEAETDAPTYLGIFEPTLQALSRPRDRESLTEQILTVKISLPKPSGFSSVLAQSVDVENRKLERDKLCIVDKISPDKDVPKAIPCHFL